MGKVLISSIGNNRLNKEGRYNETTYFIDRPDGTRDEYTSSYIFEALVQMEHIDRVILIGTAGSGWKPLYEYITMPEYHMSMAATGITFDPAYRDRLSDLDSRPGLKDMSLEEASGILAPLKDCLDPQYKAEILLMRYGLNNSDWDENLQVLGKIEALLEDGDSLYLDVTHSFRSLPIFQMLAISYFQNLSSKHINVEKLTYGMFEVRNEYGQKTPIVDLNRLYDMMEFVKLAGEYRQFGTAYGLKKLEEKPGCNYTGFNEKQISLLTDLGDMVSINNLDGFQELVRNAEQILNTAEGGGTEFPILAKAICQDICSNFGDGISDPIMTQFNLARWHMEKKRYQNAMTTAREACITLTMDLCGATGAGHSERDPYASLLGEVANDKNKKLAQSLDTASVKMARYSGRLQYVRNMLAHPSSDVEVEKTANIAAVLVTDRVTLDQDTAMAEAALQNHFGVTDPAARKDIIERLQKAGKGARKSIQKELASSLSDPFAAAVDAAEAVLEGIQTTYRESFFGDSEEVQARKAALKDALLAIKAKSDAKKAARVETEA